MLKGHDYLPSLATSCENMALIKKFPNNLCRSRKPFKTNQLTTYKTGDSPAAKLSHWGQASSRKPNVEDTVFQTFLNYKRRSFIHYKMADRDSLGSQL